jgi:hypothetical protein
MRWTSFAVGFGTVAGIVVSSVGVVHAASTLDQDIAFSTDSASWIYSAQSGGQSFTAGKSGPLSSVAIVLSNAGSAADLTVELTNASSDLPTGSALATATISSGDVPSWPSSGTVTATFSSPATVTAGEQYAILVTTSATGSGGDHYEWNYDSSATYSGGSGLDDRGSGGAWQTVSHEFSLRTYVTVASGSSSGSSRAAPATVDVNLGLSADDGSVTSSWSAPTVVGTWKQLPESTNVVGAGDNLGKVFLGIATTEDFPVEIAQRQIDNGWGAYEIYSDDGRLSSVFIPAGGWAHVTAQPRLFPVWSD